MDQKVQFQRIHPQTEKNTWNFQKTELILMANAYLKIQSSNSNSIYQNEKKLIEKFNGSEV